MRVLLVEDSPDDAELIEMEMIRGGLKPSVLRVETAGQMRTALEGQGWDVVLSDFHLPAFGAAEALDVLHQSGCDLPFLILSGMVRAEEAVKLMKRGAHDFLDKGALARLVPAMEREMRDAAERQSRRAAEEQVRILSMAVEQSPVAVMISDTKGVIAYVNPRFCETSGYGRDEVVGHSPDITMAAGPGDDSIFASAWEHLRSGHAWRGMFRNQRKDGTVYWDEAFIAPVRDLGGRISHYVSITQDVTERQLHEQELRRAVEKLTKANTELERFAYVASHDLQEPLRTLTSFTQLLRRCLDGSMPPEAREYMGFIVAAARRMYELINDLLAYSRVTSEERAFSCVSLAAAARVAVGNLAGSIKEAAAIVTLEDLPEKVLGDEVQLMQLFQNLIGNAVKFRRPGQAPRVRVAAERDGDNWRVSVHDDGIGIAASNQDIFEIFRRLHSQSEYPGTGVGLAICKCIVERHGGRIWVESQPGRGSTFFFTVPAIA